MYLFENIGIFDIPNIQKMNQKENIHYFRGSKGTENENWQHNILIGA